MDLVGYSEIVRMIQAGARRIRLDHANLSRLDSAIGDGDHGSAMLRAMEAAEKAVRQAGRTDAGGLLQEIGWGVMSAAGGATGPLLGSFFVGLGEGVVGDGLDCRGVAAMFEAALANVRKQTPAKVGDKTVIDALVPAVEALRAAADAGAGVGEAVKQAADAAAKGAEATRNMRARLGRARNLGERTVGHVDPGAASMAALFLGFAEGLAPG